MSSTDGVTVESKPDMLSSVREAQSVSIASFMTLTGLISEPNETESCALKVFQLTRYIYGYYTVCVSLACVILVHPTLPVCPLTCSSDTSGGAHAPMFKSGP